MLVGEIIGKGNTAEVYERKDQHQKVVKLFLKRYRVTLLKRNLKRANGYMSQASLLLMLKPY
jgi:RIO-like serine/threonine protein kinase